jgi:hypothetical protein
MCFVWVWKQTAIISLHSMNWLVCIMETECVYCAVWTNVYNSLYITLLIQAVTIWTTRFNFQKLYVLLTHGIFVCFVWISEKKTAIISLSSINWLVFTTETECVYCAVWNAYTYKFKSVKFAYLEVRNINQCIKSDCVNKTILQSIVFCNEYFCWLYHPQYIALLKHFTLF